MAVSSEGSSGIVWARLVSVKTEGSLGDAGRESCGEDILREKIYGSFGSFRVRVAFGLDSRRVVSTGAPRLTCRGDHEPEINERSRAKTFPIPNF